MNKEQELISINALKEFIDGELSDYSFINKVTDYECHGEEDEILHVFVDIENQYDEGKTIQCMEFTVKNARLDVSDDTYVADFEVCLYEDHYETIKSYDWQIKYFWMAFMVFPKATRMS